VSLRRSTAFFSLLLALAVPSTASAFTVVQLQAKLARDAARFGPSASVMVKDLDSGKVLYSLRPDAKLIPASNQKLFTTSVALMRHGPDGTLTTALRAPTTTLLDPATGIFPGDVYLVGGGDPTLDDATLRTLARQLRQAGVTNIAGAIVADESYFDRRRGSFDSNWKVDSDLSGQLSALPYKHGRSGSALKAAERLARYIEATGTSILGETHVGRLYGAGQELAVAPSPTIAELARMINVPSENFYAEMLAKELGATFGSKGSTGSGMSVIGSTLSESVGIKPRLVDGSGLSRGNRTTTRQLIKLLSAVHEDVLVSLPFAESLPRAGQEGTLKRRMRNTTAARRCAAKTGTLIGVSSLTGYCTTATDGTIAFSMIENQVNTGGAKSIEDRLVKTIARYEPALGADQLE
jgi:D-alanyl-D-alanine carboxypeptidase/D-alanyl-D-alanine-endopeptidase (penicillin-binding protein 4)